MPTDEIRDDYLSDKYLVYSPTVSNIILAGSDLSRSKSSCPEVDILSHKQYLSSLYSVCDFGVRKSQKLMFL
jgi:hypothetical protein